jgi:protoporphyrinogen oxidase
MYYANNLFRLSTPLDLLRFSPLPFFDRIRLGLLALRSRRVKEWRALEDRTAADWLREMGGKRVYRVVWEPLLRGKFGDVAEEVSAVWFWNKLKLRGGSRGKGGEEQLAYYRHGFAALADAMAEAIRAQGGEIRTNSPVSQLHADSGQVTGLVVAGETISADAVIATPALPIIADLMKPHVSSDYIDQLRRIRYLANICVVLELDRSLSNTYWLNVNDPGFPFVGVIEHTNFEPVETYGGRHIVYLSKYLPETDPLYQMADAEVVDFTLEHLARMFPDLTRNWVYDAHVWRAQHSQPIVECDYSQLIPSSESPLAGAYIATMAQIYPEDRGTNYAIRQGRSAAKLIIEEARKR